jgi:hypothetical protein
MDGSMLRFYASQRILNQLGTKDQHRALISTVHRVTDLVGISHAKDQSRIGVGNYWLTPVMQQKDSTARHHDLGCATPLLATAT